MVVQSHAEFDIISTVENAGVWDVSKFLEHWNHLLHNMPDDVEEIFEGIEDD